MAKKKKTQLKPVARGFATTSVPKKVTPVEEEVDTASVSENHQDGNAKLNTSTGVSIAGSPLLVLPEDFDPDKVEEQSLQNLVDKFQVKLEREIMRALKAVELDRRFSKSLPRLDLDPLFVDRILDLAKAESTEVIQRTVDEPEEKAVFKLGITYGTLRRLGFTEERVEECLRAINGVDIEEAYEWLYLHCAEEELIEKREDINDQPTTPRTPVGHKTPHIPRTPSDFLTPPTSTSKKIPSRLDAKAPAFVPLNKLPLVHAESMTDEEESMPVHATATIDYTTSSYGLERDSDDTLAEYVRLKLQLTALISRRHQFRGAEAAQLKEITARLDVIKANYFFDEEEAEAEFQLERERVYSRALQDRLRGEIPIDSLPLTHLPIAKQLTSQEDEANLILPPTATAPDIFDDSDDTQGGVLDLLDEIPSTTTNDEGIVMRVRDMSLPKHWSGRTPKVLLTEIVAKVDRYAAVTYHDISGHSRAKRAGVKILWEGRKSGQWLMEDVACHDMLQAEQYIATIALHALTFPPNEGFAAGTSGTGGQTFFRLLPAVFRDLWDELEERRKASIDAVNRAVWAKLRSIVEPKIELSEKPNEKNPKLPLDIKDGPKRRPLNHNQDTASEQLMDAFRLRLASPLYQEMLQQRNQLPIARYRNEIIASLDSSQILVLSGETGCGKSTQVPAFILEDQLSRGKSCKIYCTEPRRISAISLAQRVSRELGDMPGAVGTINSLVGYSIRLESNTTRNTRLAFVTNGIALRMLEGGSGQGGQGTAFDEITHIIIDEVHERTIESDFLLIVLKSLIDQRPDLKIVLMSATVDAEKISNFFGGCPTLHVPGRTFPVEVQFLEDAVEYTQWTILEGSPYARRLHDKFYRGKNKMDWSEESTFRYDEDEDSVQENVNLEKRYSQSTAATINLLDERLIPYDLIVRLLERICFEDATYTSYSAAVLIFMPGMGEIRRLNDILSEHPMFGSGDAFKIYPLHSTLSSENQGVVFDIPPLGVRKIVIATNIAETGITIPDITCVIDSGKHREMRFDEKRQISRLVETYIAKSNAAQRRGRAGRVQNGLCFHLFTRLRHDTQMAEHPLPEMMRLSLSDLALRIKIMRVSLGSSIEDVLSRAMDPPASINIQRAISVLVEVRALTPTEEITPMGRLLSKLPTDVHLGKFLLIAALFKCLDPALTIAATLNAKSPFVSPFGFEHEADRAKNSFRVGNSDFLTIHNAFASWRRASANPSFVRKFCRTNFLSHQNMQQIEELRQQFLGYLIDSSFIKVDKAIIRELSRARYGRYRTRFLNVPPELDCNSNDVALLNAALAAGLYPKVLAVDSLNGQMRTISNNQPAAFHPSSVNFGKKPADFGVNHLAYFTLMHSKKLYAWETGPVDDMAMLLLCGDAESKLISNSIFIDRKIRFQVSPKTNIAIKSLRIHLTSLLADQFRSKSLTESQFLWNEMAMMVLGKIKGEESNQIAIITN